MLNFITKIKVNTFNYDNSVKLKKCDTLAIVLAIFYICLIIIINSVLT